MGDAVLYLDHTPCRNIVLFGSCGAVDGLNIGDLVLPYACYALESFSQMLLERRGKRKVFYPDEHLLKTFWQANQELPIKKVKCLTVSSLKLE